jgi:protein involved in polysaccharide export with SLBB domain
MSGAVELIRSLAHLLTAALAALFLSACAMDAPPPADAASAAAPPSLERGYVLGAGDKLRIVVFNENELSREYEVDGSGKVSMLLVGPVQASGLTPREFEADLTGKLKKVLRNPKVSVDVIGYRPFYILGEVNKAGEYPYRNGMNVLSAIAAAGGYSYRANTRVVYIQRGNDPERSYEVTTRIPIYPGDVLRVPERFF